MLINDTTVATKNLYTVYMLIFIYKNKFRIFRTGKHYTIIDLCWGRYNDLSTWGRLSSEGR